MANKSLYELSILQDEVTRRCGRENIHVRISDTATAACTDGKEVIIPAIRDPMSETDAVVLRTEVIHECGHIRRPEVFDILNDKHIPKGHPMGMLFNIVEDDAQERDTARRYAGDKLALGQGHRIISRSILDTIKDGVQAALAGGETTLPLSEEQERMTAAFTASFNSREDWDDVGCATLPMWNQLIPATSAKALTQQVMDAGFVDKMRNTKTPYDSYDVAKEMYRVLYSDEPPIEEQEKQWSDAHVSGSGKKDGTGKPGDSKDGKGGGKGNKGKPADRKEFVVVDWRDFMQSEHKTTNKGAQSAGMSVNWKGKSKRPSGHALFPNDQIRIFDYPRDGKSAGGQGVDQGYSCYSDSLTVSERTGDAALANNVRRLIQASRRIKWKGEQLSGRINNRHLHRVLMPEVGNGEWNERVFKVKTQKDAINTCVTILVDWSGSMSGTKMGVACTVSQRLYDTFTRVLRVPTEILSFTSNYYGTNHAIIKGYHERRVDNRDIKARFEHFMAQSSGNADADALLWAVKRARSRREKRRLVIVLSDGNPSCCYQGQGQRGRSNDADSMLLQVTQEVAKIRDVEVYGIGICDDNVRRYYGEKAQVIHDPLDLNTVLIKTLQEALLK